MDTSAHAPSAQSTGKWPKVLPALTPEQQLRSDEFMKLWHVEVAGRPRHGLIEKFNHSFPVDHSPRGFPTTLEIGAGLGEHLNHEQLSPEQERGYFCNESRENMAAEIRRRSPTFRPWLATASSAWISPMVISTATSPSTCSSTCQTCRRRSERPGGYSTSRPAACSS
jgi:hypothetical protein